MRRSSSPRPPRSPLATLAWLLAVPLALPLVACGGGDYGGDFGATPGGVKDMHFARELIAAGQVPPPEALLVEGMFAEHDLGLAGDACTQPLCVRAAAGIAPGRGGEPRGWLQVGLSSNVDPDAWQRPATTFIFTVDVSGSMGWDYQDEPSPGALSRDLLHRLADQLGATDEVAIVTYGNDVRTALPVHRGDDHAAVHAAIDGLSTDGSTDMEAGLRRAYDLGRDAVGRGRDNVRIVLFTDVQPNVGATSSSDFEAMVAAGADAGVDITVVALGLGIGPEVLQGMAHLRGANAFSLFRFADVETFMADEYPWFTTPLAYDLTLDVAPSAGLAVDTAYGFPTGPGEDPGLDVSTVFLSKRHGALLVSLRADAVDALDGLAADLTLSFTTPGGDVRSQQLHVARDGAAIDERGQWFAQPSVATTTALALLVSGMHDAAAAYAVDPAGAQAVMDAADVRFAADAAGLADPDLDVEVALSAAMRQLVADRAPQGSLYGLDL
ncbi:MAG: VWA domain-containing protein [Kofleriaceae bacterium]|nr:VWA domain-containing protein [Kofleriaceae bacterium]